MKEEGRWISEASHRDLTINTSNDIGNNHQHPLQDDMALEKATTIYPSVQGKTYEDRESSDIIYKPIDKFHH